MIEQRRALQEKFLGDREKFAEFCAGFADELNRLRREHRARLAAAPREVTAINRRSRRSSNCCCRGFALLAGR